MSCYLMFGTQEKPSSGTMAAEGVLMRLIFVTVVSAVWRLD